MNAKNLLASSMLALLAAACGGSDTPATPATPATSTLSCNIAASGICLALSGPTTSLNVAGFNTGCTKDGGTSGTACPAANRVGTCRFAVTAPVTDDTIVFYGPTLTAADAQTVCLAMSGTWVP